MTEPPSQLDPRKFQDPFLTVKGERRAHVALRSLDTLWFNTGTLCNLTCQHCYIESSPKNDRLIYLTAAEVAEYLDEIEAGGLPTSLIGFTGGEPFMNPELPRMLEDVLPRGFRALILTNAMKPMAKCKPALLKLRDRFGDRLTIRVSIDHYGPQVHEVERGKRGRQSTGSCGWRATGFRRTSPAAGFRESRKRRYAAALPGCSPSLASQSTPPIRWRSRCFRKWMPPPMFRRSPKRAGAFSGNRRRASCARLRG
jgi:hypothetical protein